MLLTNARHCCDKDSGQLNFVNVTSLGEWSWRLRMRASVQSTTADIFRSNKGKTPGGRRNMQARSRKEPALAGAAVLSQDAC